MRLQWWRARRPAVILAPIGLLFAVCVSAQQRSEPFWAQGQALRGAEAPRVRFLDDGYVASAGAAPGTAFSAGIGRAAASPEEAALAFVSTHARWFFDGAAEVGFKVDRVREDQSRSLVHLSQTYRGLPVFGAGVAVQVRGTDIEYLTSDVMRDSRPFASGAVSMSPLITAGEAQQFALAWAASKRLATRATATAPALAIYDPEVVGNAGGPLLVWQFEVADPAIPVREVVLVNADDGDVAFSYSLIHDAKIRQVFDANNTNSFGALARAEGQGPTGNVHVDEAYDYLGDTYDFYFSEHGRDSLNNAGAILSATVRYCDPFYPCPYGNAFWDGSRMWFGQGFQVDDVTSHELTHGVTTNESNLIYANQSGAINESFSDMWGEWVDLGNGAGNDTAGVRWLMGEDIPGIGAIRNMANPPAFGDPDRMGSPLFYTGSFDNGGVHINSGVGNKLAYLLTDGGFFNGFTVSAMGISATADLMYECQVNLLNPASNYFDLYDAITQAAINIGFNLTQRDNVEDACLAVEIRQFAGVTGFQATTGTAVPQIDLSWVNPTQGSFTEVRLRRSTTSFPLDPNSDGILLYQGPGTSYSDSAVTVGTLYYYTIWAYHGPTNRSGPAHASAQAGVVASSPSEQFTAPSDSFDVEFLHLTFTPNGANAYDVRQIGWSSFPTNPSTGFQLPMGDDSFQQVNLTGGAQITLFGTQYTSFFVSSNGRITFGSGSTEYLESFAGHFALPGISALFDDLDPSSGGAVRVQQFSNRVVVTYRNVPEFGTSNQNNAQVEMFFSGLITLTYLGVASNDSIVGISAGGGIPSGFAETDLSGAPLPGVSLRAWILPVLAAALVTLAAAAIRMRIRRWKGAPV